MIETDYIHAALFEHRFWMYILEDHARFLYFTLSANETAAIKKSSFFIDIFGKLRTEADKDLNAAELDHFNRQANYYTQEFIKFNAQVLKKELIKKISINLPPMFLNHMLRESDEYLIILADLLNKKIPAILNPSHYHLEWLLDIEKHAATIVTNLDGTQKDLLRISESYVKEFRALYLEAVGMADYQSYEPSFPAFGLFNEQVEEKVMSFNNFLLKLETLTVNKQVLGTAILSPLYISHMYREQCYYLIKVAQATGRELPKCNPLK